jgi:tripeptide aminopeptidase
MNFERMKKLFFTLLETDSPYGHEQNAAAVIGAFLDDQGTAWSGGAERDGSSAKNLIAAGPGSARLSFCAHMDTIRIFEKKQPRCEGSIVRAPGGGVLGIDDMSGAALTAELAASLAEKGGIPPDIHFLFTIGEECGFTGAWALDPRHFSEAHTFVIDSGGVPLVRVVRRGTGQITFTVTLRGVMGHASGQGTENAALFQARLVPLLKPGKAGTESFIHIGSVECPGSPNTVPDLSTVSGQILFFDAAEGEAVLAEMQNTVEAFARETGCQAECTAVRDCAPWAVPADDPIIARAASAAARAGLPFALGQTGSGSDAQVIAQRGGKTVKISTGMLNPHSKNEQIDLEDMRRCGEYLEQLALS